MTTKTQSVQKLDIVRQHYAASLSAEIAPLEFARDCLISKTGEAAARDDLLRQSHRLAGSAGTFGFQHLSALALELEHYLDTNPKLPRERASLIGMIDAFLETISDIADGTTPASKIVQPIDDTTPLSNKPTLTLAASTADFAEAITPAPATRHKLLIIEDDSIVCDLLDRLLGDEVETIILGDGAAAVAVAARHMPDLILLDNDLPGANGLEIIKQLQKTPAVKSIPIMMMTGNNEPENVIAAFAAGAKDYFTKPFEPVSFAKKIREILTRTEYTVMVVDDDPSIRDLIDYRFESLGVNCIQAGDGIKALEKIRDTPPDLIILDRMMPGLDGAGVLHHLKNDPELEDIPVIILTVRNKAGDAHEWLRRGAIDFITKPFDPEELILRASRALQIEDLAG